MEILYAIFFIWKADVGTFSIGYQIGKSLIKNLILTNTEDKTMKIFFLLVKTE